MALNCGIRRFSTNASSMREPRIQNENPKSRDPRLYVLIADNRCLTKEVKTILEVGQKREQIFRLK